jgi:hypothetical protein
MKRRSRIPVWLFVLPVAVIAAAGALFAIISRGDDEESRISANSEVFQASSSSQVASPNTSSRATPAASVATTTTSTPIVRPQQPTITTEVVYLQVEPETRLMRFVALINNQSNRTVEGLRVRWDATDSSGAIVGSFTNTMPAIPAGTVYTYVGGAGAANITGVPDKVKLTVLDTGKLTDAPSGVFTVDSITLDPERFSLQGQQYRVGATLTIGPDRVERFKLKVAVVLRDGNGKIVGAHFTTPTNVPEVLEPGTKVRVELPFLSVTDQPISADVISHG